MNHLSSHEQMLEGKKSYACNVFDDKPLYEEKVSYLATNKQIP